MSPNRDCTLESAPYLSPVMSMNDVCGPKNYIVLEELVVCTRKWTVHRVDGALAEEAGCRRQTLELFAIMAQRPAPLVERGVFRAAWKEEVSSETVKNAVARMFLWAEKQGVLKRRGRATATVHAIEWLRTPRWVSAAPWDRVSGLDSVVRMLRGSPLPTCVTDYVEEPIQMNVVWANAAYLRFVGWESFAGKTVQDIYERVSPIIEPSLHELAEGAQRSIMEDIRDGLDFHLLGPFPIDRARFARLYASTGSAEERYEGVALANMVRDDSGARIGAFLQYLVLRDGSPQAWCDSLNEDEAFCDAAWPGSRPAGYGQLSPKHAGRTIEAPPGDASMVLNV